MPPTRVLTLTLATALAALALAGCGRRGALEPPPAAATPRTASQNPATDDPATKRAGAAAGPRSLAQSTGLGGGSPEPDPTAVRDGDELSPSALAPAGTEAPVETGRGAKRGYRIPKDPFLLDPLL